MADAHLPPPLPRRRSVWGCALVVLLGGSLLLNFVFCGVSWYATTSDDEDRGSIERPLYGPKSARDKVAVIRAEGALIEGLDRHILKQIETAARDDAVKAVVLRIDSPGGTIGASDDIHRDLVRLRDGNHPRYRDVKAKKIVASMGSIAASGGYYIAMPAEKIFVERNTLTGSIGVYASLPNVAKLANDHGVRMELIKAGGIKASGSPFHEMTPAERQPWQDMVDQAYEQFLDVVAAGRPALTKEQFRSEVVNRKQVLPRDDKGNVVAGAKGIEVVRYRADGGTFTAVEAKKYGLVDEFGQLEDAVAAVASSAGLGNYRVVTYERPPSLLMTLLGVKAPSSGPDLAQLSAALMPRIWYMVPQAELTGMLSASGR